MHAPRASGAPRKTRAADFFPSTPTQPARPLRRALPDRSSRSHVHRECRVFGLESSGPQKKTTTVFSTTPLHQSPSRPPPCTRTSSAWATSAPTSCTPAPAARTRPRSPFPSCASPFARCSRRRPCANRRPTTRPTRPACALLVGGRPNKRNGFSMMSMRERRVAVGGGSWRGGLWVFGLIFASVLVGLH